MDFETLKYIPRATTQSNSIGAVASAMDKLSAKHESAIEKQSAIQEYLGKLKLNSAEDQWKFNKIQEVNSSIDEKANFGNYAGAVTTAVKKAGEIASSPELMGRIRAQEDYEKFTDTIDNDKRLDGRIKQWSKEQNGYHYEDKLDDKGNIIGGTKWEPNVKPVEQVDITTLMGPALQIAAKEAGGSSTIYYMGADNKLTTNAKDSVDGLPYTTKSGKYERLPASKIKAAMQTIIANTPGAKESIEQDYNVSKYFLKKQVMADSKTNPVNTDITDRNGLLLSKDQYLNKRLDPFYTIASYNHSFTDETAGAGQTVAAQRARAVSAATANAANVTPYSPTSVSAGNVEEKANTAAEVKAKSYSSRRELIKSAASLSVKVPLTASTDALYNIIANRVKQLNGKMSASAAKAILDDADRNRNDYHNSNSAFNDLIKGASTTDRMSAEFVTQVDTNASIGDLLTNDKHNIYAAQYANNINKIHGAKGKALRYTMTNDQFNKAVTKLDAGVRGSHLKAGFKTGRDEHGNMYIELNKADGFKTHQLINVTNQVGRLNASVIDYNGKTIKSFGEINGALTSINALYDKTNNNYKKLLNARPAPIISSMDSFSDDDIMISDLKRQGQLADEDITDTKAKIAMAKEAIVNNLRTFEGGNIEMYSQDAATTTFKKVNLGNDRINKVNHIQTLLANDEGAKRVTVTTGMHNGVLGTLVTVAPGIKPSTGSKEIGEHLDRTAKVIKNTDIPFESGGYKVFIPNLIESAQKKRVENDPAARAALNLQRTKLNGYTEIKLNSNYSNPALPNTKIKITKDGNYHYDSDFGSKSITKEEAINLQIASDEYSSLRNYVRAIGVANIPPEAKADIDARFIKSIYTQLGIPAGTNFNDLSDSQKATINKAYANLD